MATELQKLPIFFIPQSIKQAQINIENLGRSMAEHAYLIGCNLIWTKSQLKHGEFILWIENNVWFERTTATRFMKFAINRNKEKFLLKYSPRGNVAPCNISNESAQILPGQYRTVIIDPPWPYGTQYDKDTRRVASPYPEMTIEAIALTQFPFADDCILWLWTTHRFLPISFDLLGTSKIQRTSNSLSRYRNGALALQKTY